MSDSSRLLSGISDSMITSSETPTENIARIKNSNRGLSFITERNHDLFTVISFKNTEYIYLVS